VRCAVVGGGLAGLASAVWLAEAGHEVTLLEQRAALGGRAHSIALPELGDVPDNGQHVFLSVYEHLFRFLDSVGTRRHLVFPGYIGMRFPGGAYRKTATWGLAGARLALGDLPGVTGLDRLRTARAQVRLVAEALNQPADLDALTADAWLRRVGMPASARKAIWDGVVIGYTGDKPARSSAKAPADLIRTGTLAALKLRTPVSIGYANVPLDALFVAPAERFFAARGVTVRTRAQVRAIDVARGRVAGVTLAGGERLGADAVICAVPVWRVRGLLDRAPERAAVERAAAHLTPVPIVSVNLYLDRDLGMTAWGELLYGGEGELEQVWDRQHMHGRVPAKNWFYSTTVSAAYELIERSNAEITAAQLAALARYYPAARGARVVHSHVVRMPYATIAQRPGSAGVRPAQRTAVPGLALAGDWTDTGWTVTMEGACKSAALAVAELVRQAAAVRQPR
jgi:squalene-associated FAD-dependent desaturase